MTFSVTSGSGFLAFFIITSIFFLIKIMTNEDSIMITAVYALSILIIEYFVNLSLSNQQCGEPNYSMALSITVIPWTFMFGAMNVLIGLFPGWVRPFANTFGYAALLLVGGGKLISQIIRPNTENGSSGGDDVLAKIIAQIYENTGLLLNEIPNDPTGFDKFWTTMKPLMFPEAFDNSDLKMKLKKMIKIKYSIGEYIWYMITGLLVTSVSTNYLLNNGCQLSVAEMQQRHNQYMEDETSGSNLTINGKSTPPPKIYSTNE
tara:strand:+ start:320 stop:1102 length:783 start_codon:yes stop_codon:yes gene_type:complete